jgi:hypothetical protein
LQLGLPSLEKTGLMTLFNMLAQSGIRDDFVQLIVTRSLKSVRECPPDDTSENCMDILSHELGHFTAKPKMLHAPILSMYGLWLFRHILMGEPPSTPRRCTEYRLAQSTLQLKTCMRIS